MIVSIGDCPSGWVMVIVWVPSLFSLTEIVGGVTCCGVRSTTSIEISFVMVLFPLELVTVTGISYWPATVGVPSIVFVCSLYVSPLGSLVWSTLTLASEGTCNVTGLALFPRTINWRSFFISRDTGSSITFKVIISSAVPFPNESESTDAFIRILYTPAFVGVPLIVWVARS